MKRFCQFCCRSRGYGMPISFGMQTFAIQSATALLPDISAIRDEAASEGFRFVDRLIADWTDGSNRFDRAGEEFIVAFEREKTLGFCGLKYDPHVVQENVGRIQHLYVRRFARRRSVGSTLIKTLVSRASAYFSIIRLRTDTLEAATFYEGLGFQPIDDETASHFRVI